MDDEAKRATLRALRRRYRRIRDCDGYVFELACRDFLAWIEAHPILSYILKSIPPPPPEVSSYIQLATTNEFEARKVNDPGHAAGSYDLHLGVCLAVLRAIASVSSKPPFDQADTLHVIVRIFRGGYSTDSAKADIELLRGLVVKDLYFFLAEQLDSRRVLLGLLLKYKRRTEWFGRERARKLAKEGLESRTGERALSIDLDSYLFDQGLDFSIEPTSGSGEADAILAHPDGTKIIIEKKLIEAAASPSAIKRKLGEGFHQTFRYCHDYQQPDGYLVVFVATTRRVHVNIPANDGQPYFSIAGKTIYLILILIGEEPSASKSGKANEVWVESEDLKNTIENTARST